MVSLYFSQTVSKARFAPNSVDLHANAVGDFHPNRWASSSSSWPRWGGWHIQRRSQRNLSTALSRTRAIHSSSPLHLHEKNSDAAQNWRAQHTNTGQASERDTRVGGGRELRVRTMGIENHRRHRTAYVNSSRLSKLAAIPSFNCQLAIYTFPPSIFVSGIQSPPFGQLEAFGRCSWWVDLTQRRCAPDATFFRGRSFLEVRRLAVTVF